MSYKVFISHSVKDQKLVQCLAERLSSKGLQVFVAEWEPTPGIDLKQKVFCQIDACDCVVAILTEEGVRSEWVNQELGYAYKSQKLIIPIVEKKVKTKGVLEGKEYVSFDKENVESIYNAMVTAMNYINSKKMEKEQRNRALVVAAIIILVIIIFFAKE